MAPDPLVALPDAWRRFLAALETPLDYPSPDDLDRLLDAWAAAGARVEVVGASRGGRPIRAAVIGQGPRRLLAWGYPHSDEPIGAAGLAALGQAVLDGRLDLGWQLCLVLCADPDQAARNRWLQGPTTLERFVAGCWRPANTGIEVDYGFPLDWGPFRTTPDFQGRCRTVAECLERCGGGPCLHRREPFGPLAESLALKEAIDRYRPDLAASMHNAVLGGDYAFLLEDPGDRAETLVSLPGVWGRPRHLGEPLDRGRRWRRDAPDLIREQRLWESVAWLKRHPGYQPDLVYPNTGAFSAGNYLEANYPGVQFSCPEVCHFQSSVFADTEPLDERERATVAVEERRRGRYEVVRVEIDGQWLIAEQRRSAAPLERPRLVERAPSRASLGLRALRARQQTLAAADELWGRVLAVEPAHLVDHPYLDERFAQDRPGRQAEAGARRLFLSSPAFHQPVSRAQAASFRYSWPAETAARLGNMQNFLAVQELDEPRLAAVQHDLDELQRQVLAPLPAELRVERPRADALRSHLARLLALLA